MIELKDGIHKFRTGNKLFVDEKRKLIIIEMEFGDLYDLLQTFDVLIHLLKKDGFFWLRYGSTEDKDNIKIYWENMP